MRPGATRQIAQKTGDLLRRFGHFGHQRQLAVAAVAQQAGFLGTQLQQLGHQRAVVAIYRAELAGSGRVSMVELLAQGAILGVLHHRQVDRHVQRELVACLVFGGGARPGLLADIVGDTGHLLGAGVERVAVGCVEHMLAELLSQFSQTLLDCREANLGLALQFGAREQEIAHRMGQRLAPGWHQAGRSRAARNSLVFGVEPLVGAQPGMELGDARQVGVVGLTQLGRVGHCIEVAHGLPGAIQALERDVERG